MAVGAARRRMDDRVGMEQLFEGARISRSQPAEHDRGGEVTQACSVTPRILPAVTPMMHPPVFVAGCWGGGRGPV